MAHHSVVLLFVNDLVLERIWLKLQNVVFKCNFICSQVVWKSLHLKSLLQLTSPLFPGGSSSLAAFFGVMCLTLPLPSVNALSSNNGFTTHVLRDGGCFPFYPLFNGKICASDILTTHECDWGWRVEKSESMSERTEREAWWRTGCAMMRAQIDCFVSVNGSCRCYKRL